MKILYLTTHSPWPQVAGSRIRSASILRLLARRNDVSIALLSRDESQIAAFKGDSKTPFDLHILPGKPALFKGRCRAHSLERYRMNYCRYNKVYYRKDVLDLIDRVKPDLIWAFRLHTMWLSGTRPFSVPTICDVDDYESKAYSRVIKRLPMPGRLIAQMDYRLFLKTEIATAQTCRVLLVSNPDDRLEFERCVGRPVVTMPNGFDFSPLRSLRTQRFKKRVLFYGLLTYPPNVEGLRWLVREVWPLIRRAIPDAQLDVAGKYFPTGILANEVATQPGVTMLGFVDDLTPLIQRSSCLVVPLFLGGGTRIKILEAWSQGLPVASTHIGCEGLGAVDGETLLIGDTASELAAACLSLLNDSDKAGQIAERAYEYGKTHFDWNQLAPIVDDATLLAAQDAAEASQRK